MKNEFNFLQHINQISYNIDILREHLNEIHQSVNLTKVGIISKYILHPDGINSVREHLTNQRIKIISVEHICELLNLQAYYNNSNIIFNIKIPNLLETPTRIYHLKSIPIHKNGTILIPIPYLILSKVHFNS